MDEKTLIVLSVILFLAGLTYFIVSLAVGKERRKKWKLSPFVGLAVGTVFAMGCLYYNGYGGTNTETFLERVLMTILGTIGAWTGGNGVEDTRAQVSEMGRNPTYLFAIYTASLHFASSSVVFVAVLKIVDVLFPTLRYLLFGKNHVYIFSSLTERGVLLAENIHGKHPKDTLVFLDNEKDANKDALKKRASEISAYVFGYDVRKFWLPFFSKNREIDFMLLKDNHDDNVKEALALAKKYADRKVHIHLLNENTETLDLLDAADEKSEAVLRLINEPRMVIYHLLDEDPLFLYNKECPDILILGAGRMGREAIKACSWCATSLKNEPKIYVVDKDVSVVIKLEKEAPEMMSSESIQFKEMDVETSEFVAFLRAHRQIGYVICTLGDDRLNLRTAMDIRGVSYEVKPFGTEKKPPAIHVLLNDEFMAETAKELTFAAKTFETDKEGERKKVPRRINYELKPFGELKDFYTLKNICASPLEGAGLAVDYHYYKIAKKDEIAANEKKKQEGKKYDEVIMLGEDKFYEQNYNQFNYNRDSSIACALHIKYRLYQFLEEMNYLEYIAKVDWVKGLDKDTKTAIEKYLNSDEGKEAVEELAILEHKRWNAYMRSEGWKTADAKTAGWNAEDKLADHRNFAAKLHCNLVEWENLDEYTQEYDRVLVCESIDILEKADIFMSKGQQ